MRVLLAANVASMRARYPHGVTEPETPYVFQLETNPVLLHPLFVIKQAQCFDYQACEVNDYQKTVAAAITRAIINKAIECMPGYANMAWGIDDAPRTVAAIISTDATRGKPADTAPVPVVVEHVTARGKTLRGIVRSDLTRTQAKAIDPYTFRKDGGWFIREAAPVAPVAPVNAAPVVLTAQGQARLVSIAPQAAPGISETVANIIDAAKRGIATTRATQQTQSTQPAQPKQTRPAQSKPAQSAPDDGPF
jgi:hypothetical protein